MLASLAPIMRFVLYAAGIGFAGAAGNALLTSRKFGDAGQGGLSAHQVELAQQYAVAALVAAIAGVVWHLLARRKHHRSRDED